MSARAWPGQAVEFERVRERAVGECRCRRLDRRAAAEDVAPAAGAGALGIVDDNTAPRQAAAANASGNRVDDAIFRLLHDWCRQILIAERGGILGETDGFLRHVILLREKRTPRRIKPWKRSGAKSST